MAPFTTEQKPKPRTTIDISRKASIVKDQKGSEKTKPSTLDKHIVMGYVQPIAKPAIEKPSPTSVERTSPRTRSSINLKGKSTVQRKAMFFMELLWEHNYREQIHRKTLETYVEMFLGGFRQTKQFYLGHMKILGRGVGGRSGVWIPGLFEKLHYIKLKGEFWLLNHEVVPLPYHYVERLNEFSEGVVGNQQDGGSVEKGVIEFQHSEGIEVGPMKKISLTQGFGSVVSGEATERVTTPLKHIQQQHTVRERNFQHAQSCISTEDQKNEKIEENSKPGPWLTEDEKADILKRDRKRLAILDSQLLPFLEKTAKSSGGDESRG